MTNRDIIVLIGAAWPQTEHLFESVNQSSITFLLFMLKDWSAKRSVPRALGLFPAKQKNFIKYP